MLRPLIHVALALALMLQGLAAAWAAPAAPAEPAAAVEERMPCHDEPPAESAVEMPCCPDGACDCAMACHAATGVPVRVAALAVAPPDRAAAGASPGAAVPPHRVHLLRPPIRTLV